MIPDDTIIAPATPPGEGGIAVVRLSGPAAIECLAGFFVGRRSVAEMVSHHLYHGRLCRADGTMVDEVLAVIMHGPHSYTGEDVVEIHCHGGARILSSVLDLFMTAPVRLARPGEFTERAFLNGKLDLAQAEAVADIIHAKSERACRVALDQLEGRLSRVIYDLSDRLKDLLALVEAHIDFPDDEVGSLEGSIVSKQLTRLTDEMSNLIESFESGRALREGIIVLILGRPNVGKSSLMNSMLGHSRAIVTPVPGTTRDTLEEQMVVGGFPVRLIDTAGVRATDDPVEREGVRRASDKARAADLILLVVDGSQPLTEEDRMAMDLCVEARTLVVINKVDLPAAFPHSELVRFGRPLGISARTGAGLDQLQAAMVDRLGGSGLGDVDEDVLVVERRHREALVLAKAAAERAREVMLQGVPLEFLALEIREGVAALGRITGETAADEILDQIFSRFCIGK